MIIVWPDTNSLIKNQLLGAAGRELRRLAASGVCEVRISSVVRQELDRLWKREVSGLVAELNATVSKHGTNFGHDVSGVVAAVGALGAGSADVVRERFAEMERLHGVTLEQGIGTLSAAELLERDIQGRRPFTVRDGVTTGMRDALIWEGLVSHVKTSADTRFIFVTNDEGFLTSSEKTKGLHGDLVQDLDGSEYTGEPHIASFEPIDDGGDVLPSERVSYARDLWESANIVKRFAALVSTNEAVALEEFEDLIQWFAELEWRTGTMTFRSAPFEGNVPSGVSNVVIVSLDRPAEPIVQTLSEVRFKISQELDLQFAASMSKSDWFDEEATELELWDPDLNDGFVEVAFRRQFSVTADIAVNSDPKWGEVVDDTLMVD